MFIYQITNNDNKHFVPVLNSEVSSIDQNGIFPISVKRLHTFKSIELAQSFIEQWEHNAKIYSVIEIDLNRIRQWAESKNIQIISPVGLLLDFNSPYPYLVKFHELSFGELEHFSDLLTSYFERVENKYPDDIALNVVYKLLMEIFYDQRMARLNGMPTLTDDDIQIKINNPILKKYFITLIKHFERVIL